MLYNQQCSKINKCSTQKHFKDYTALYCLSTKHFDSITIFYCFLHVYLQILFYFPPNERSLYISRDSEYTNMSDSSLQCLQSFHWYFAQSIGHFLTLAHITHVHFGNRCAIRQICQKATEMFFHWKFQRSLLDLLHE